MIRTKNSLGIFAVVVCFILLFTYIAYHCSMSREIYWSSSPGATRRSCRQSTTSEEWQVPDVPSSLQGVKQGSPALAEYICTDWLLEPSRAEYKLTDPQRLYYSQFGQDKCVDDLLGNRTNGFFVECGAANGERLSNTLYFEKSRHWSGLLVEANPGMFRQVLSKQRRAYSINCCLSPQIVSLNTTFEMARVLGGLHEYIDAGNQKRIDRRYSTEAEVVTVQCFPLFSILQALGVTHIDYFSLDIEGAELDVLYTLPLDIITVDVFSIEYTISEDPEKTEQKLATITQYLADVHSYEVIQVHDTDIILHRGV